MDRMLSVAQLASTTGMSVAYWRKAVSRKELPVVRLGRSVRIREADAERFLAAGVHPPRTAGR
jgi:excisionase family DNA binding protein